jgi:uncharacterized membrane protein
MSYLYIEAKEEKMFWILWLIVGFTLYVFLKNGTCFFEDLFGHSRFFEMISKKKEAVLMTLFAICFPILFALVLFDKWVFKRLLRRPPRKKGK